MWRRIRLAKTPALLAVRLLAACVALVAQAGIASAPLVDAQQGVSTASHYESADTNLHFAHNEADCFMCRAQYLGDATAFNPSPTFHVVAEAAPIALSADTLNSSSSSSQRSRAPPVS